MRKRSWHHAHWIMASLASIAPAASHAETAATGAAQPYPARPVRVIVMSTPSSGPDILARLLNPKFAETFGQQLVIDNRAGASGIIGAEIGAKAESSTSPLSRPNPCERPTVAVSDRIATEKSH